MRGGEIVNKLKVSGMAALVGAQMSNQDWLFILSIVITVLGMIQSYLENRKEKRGVKNGS